MKDTTASSPRSSTPWWRDTQELVSSMRFAISLLALICIAAMIGTVVQQGQPLNDYVNEFGPFWSDVFHTAGLFTVYSSAWFLLILFFLVTSTSLCIARNAPRFIADFRTMKEHVRETSLKAFHHRGEGDVAGDVATAEASVTALMAAEGWQVKVDARANGTMVAARKGRGNRIGYILAHSAVVLVCLGALFDGDLVVRIQMALTGKTPYDGAGFIKDVAESHRLSTANPTFRGNLLVPEGRRNDTAVLQLPTGVVLQPLPFDIELKQFVVDYYPTGQPKLFTSQVVIHDHETGTDTPARIQVNHPVNYKGVNIFQSSMEDGGSKVRMKAVPMRGGVEPFDLAGRVGESQPLTNGKDSVTVEIASLKAIDVRPIQPPAGAASEPEVAASGLGAAIDEHLGSGARGFGTKHLRNVGPSVTYRLRDAAGQAREYQNFMQPIDLEGARVFLAGVRDTAGEEFRYLRLPADEDDKLVGWVRLRDALLDPAQREAAAAAYARAATPPGKPEMTEQLRVTSQRLLDLFAGATAVPAAAKGDATPPATGGFAAVARFIEQGVPAGEREKAAALLLRILDGSLFDLNNLSRIKAGLPPLVENESTSVFMTASVRALSDAFQYPAPFLLEMTGFDQVQASVFQVTRAPGQKLVYLGAVLLILGVFAMLYIRERRVWAWLAPSTATPGATRLTLALSTARRTLDIDAEFERLRTQLLGAPAAPLATASQTPTSHEKDPR